MNKLRLLTLTIATIPFATMCMDKQVTKSTEPMMFTDAQKARIQASLAETKRRKTPNPANFGTDKARDARRQLAQYAEAHREGKVVELEKPTLTYPTE